MSSPGALPSGLQALLIRASLRQPRIVLALALVVILYGAFALTRASYDVFPEFAPLQANIQTEAPGLSPEQVETLVTRPVEAALQGAPGQVRIQSNSIQGLSVVTVFFDQGTDIYRDRQFVAERLSEVAGTLPQGVAPPVMTPLTSSAELVLVIGLTSAHRSLLDLRTVARWTLMPAITAVPGVADVEIFGGQVAATQILVRPSDALRFGLGLNDIVSAAGQAVAIRGAGFLSTPNQRIVVQADQGAVNQDTIAQTVVAWRNGAPVTLGAVANVITAPEQAIGAGAVDGVPGVVMNITEQYGADTLRVTKGLEASLEALRPVLARDAIVLHARLFRPARFITTATGNLARSLAIGAILVVLVLFLFLSDLRSAAICCAAIPLSLLAAVAVLRAQGLSLNTMTLGGAAIALGEVVDDAVIAVENITRRLRQNVDQGNRFPAALVVLRATFEVRSAVVYATFAVILVFVPVVTLGGIGGRLFGPLGLTYITAVLASLLVALTVTPALALLLLPRHLRHRTPPVMAWSRRRYHALLRRVAAAPRLAMAAAALVTVAGLAMLPLFSATFLPDLQEGHFVVHATAVPGTSLTESLRMGARVTASLRALPFVRSVAQRAGRAELTADTHGVHESEFEVELTAMTGRDARSARARILHALADFPGLVLSANTFLTERIDETFSGYAAPVVVLVFGNDLDAIDATAQRVAAVLQTVPGAASVQVQSPPGLPQIGISLRPADLARFGFTPAEVLDAIGVAYQGQVVGQTYAGDRVFEVVVKLAPDAGRTPRALAGLLLRARDGRFVPLGRLADIAIGSGRYQIQHQGSRRLQTVTADVSGRPLSAFVGAAQARVAEQVRPPRGVYIQFTGEAEGAAAARRDLAFKTLLSAIGIILLLSVVTRHWRNLVLVLVNLPFALVGGIAAAFLSGGVLTLGSLIGFVTLFGITLRNALMMIAHFRQLTEVDGQTWTMETALRGATDRLGPILMTSLVTGLGLLPLALGMHAPGREIEGPMALVILGGLVTSMILNLLLLPTLALSYGNFAPRPQRDPFDPE
jgi:CzcA family heavy metal efflux pump